MNQYLDATPDNRLKAAIKNGDGWLYPHSAALAECWQADAPQREPPALRRATLFPAGACAALVRIAAWWRHA